MIVTGVQPGGARGLGTVQAAAVDTTEVGRAGNTADPRAERDGPVVKRGEPQPVVFPRKGVPLDQRPVSHRVEQAAARYQEDGGENDRDDAAA